MFKRLAIAGMALAAAAGLSACTDGYGYGGVGYASDGYYGGYDDPYGYGYGDPYGYGYGPGFGGASYFGWYGGFYYPGTGIYVYDRYRRPFRWSAAQQRYWVGRGNAYWRSRGGDWRTGQRGARADWRGFAGAGRVADGRNYRGEARTLRQDVRPGAGNRIQAQPQRAQPRQGFRSNPGPTRQGFRGNAGGQQRGWRNR